MRTLEHLSTTLINNYDDCGFRALESHFRRQVHGDDNEGTDPTRFGTVIHAVMEDVHHNIMIGEDVDDLFIEQKYEQHWRQSLCTNKDFYDLGKAGIVAYVKRSTQKRIGQTIAVELDFVFDLEANKVYLPEAGTKFDRKYYTKMIRDRGNTPIVSKIDRVDKVSDVEFEVYDYKTNMMPFTRDQIENSKQLGIYHMVVKALYPEAEKIWCVYDMFRHGRFPVEFPDSFIESLKTFLQSLWVQMNNSLEAPEQKLNQYCRWCEFRGKCKTYQEALDMDIASILTEKTDTPEGFIAMYEEGQKLANLAKAIDARKKEINGAIIAKIEEDGMGEGIQVLDREFYLQANPRYSFDAKEVFKVFEDNKATVLFPMVVNVSNPSLQATLKSRPDLLEKVEEFKKKNFVSPTPKSRKIKGGKISKTAGEPDAED